MLASARLGRGTWPVRPRIKPGNPSRGPVASAPSSRGACGLAVHPVVEHEERQPEDGESMLGPQFAVLDIDVELFGEALDRQHGELFGGWVDVGEVVARLVQVAAAGQDQATAGAGARQQRGGEGGPRGRGAAAHTTPAVLPGR